MHTTTSLSLLGALRNGSSQSAWRSFDIRYRPMILAFARKLGIPESEAGDIAQETVMAFVEAYRNGKYDHTKGRLRGWLFRVAHRRVADWFCHNAQLPRAEGQSHVRRILNDIDTPDTAEQIWEAEWRAFVLAATIEEARHYANPQTFELFRLYVVEEMDANEVAERMGVTRDAVYSAKSKILKHVREILPRMEEIW